ncbi:hypothetical protein C8J56DRAFT_1055612 [Mycena floridula]|nr:hypothetical protein C8J56DRAFT_1055612 [Mycena floridula]
MSLQLAANLASRISALEKALESSQATHNRLILEQEIRNEDIARTKALLEVEKEKSLKWTRLVAVYTAEDHKLSNYHNYFSLLDELDPSIPGFTQPVLDSDHEKIIDRIQLLSKRPGSRWASIVARVVGPVPDRDYLEVLDQTLAQRSECRELNKFAKFWKRLAQKSLPDVDQALEVGDESLVEDERDKYRLVDDMLEHLKLGQGPSKAMSRYTSQNILQPVDTNTGGHPSPVQSPKCKSRIPVLTQRPIDRKVLSEDNPISSRLPVSLLSPRPLARSKACKAKKRSLLKFSRNSVAKENVGVGSKT